MKSTLTEKDCPDSETLFVNFPKSVPTEAFEAVTEKVRAIASQCLEDAINGDGASEERTTAETEPALEVKGKLAVGGKGYCFLGFASHAAAAMAVAAMTGGTDGGQLGEDLVKEATELDKVSVFWSRADIKQITVKEKDSEGLNFTRVRYPADARTDCWFCLASPSCEKHLIVDVGVNCYVAQPKGPLTDTHSLIVPLAHDGKGCFAGEARDEVRGYVDKLTAHARSEGNELFVFERAVETRGGYHSHVQCVPIERGKCGKLREVVRHAAGRLNIEMKELQNEEVSLKAIVEDEEYFYMEVPTGSQTGRGTRYVTKLPKGTSGRVPIQFGRELAAVATGRPEKSHWKSCVESEEVEKSTAMAFREGFGKLHNE